MYFKLSARNVKRSFKDYFTYFLTLTFAVCIFYSFNSLSASEVMTTLNASQAEMIKAFTMLLSGVSVFVSVVLGFLIMYANNFLIRRRKKELGLYMTLGMSKYKISRIIVVETFFVGIISLAVGLLLGILVSQGLVALTVSMFKANIEQFTFVFSSEAMLKTILYFGIIFLMVMIFNSVVISRYKLIDLLTAAKKNQSLKIRKTSTSIVLFVFSIILLAVAYAVIMKYGLFESNIVWTCVGLGALGTFLFFMSLSGFALNMIQKNKNVYYKDVNMFVLRQINSKVNTTFISMTIICLMLFFTIGVFSTGFSFKASMEKNIEKMTPYDASLYTKADEDGKVQHIHDIMQHLKVDLDEYGEHHSFTVYKADKSVKDLLAPYEDDAVKFADSNLPVIKRSDFERIEAMQGIEPIDFNDEEVVLLSNFEVFQDAFDRFTEDHKTLEVNGKEYDIAHQKVHSFAYKTEFNSEGVLTAVLPDEAVEGMEPFLSVVNINYDDNQKEHDETLYKVLDESDVLWGTTKTIILDSSVGSSTMIVFVGLYLGIVFLISSAAVLALQQLSEASDNIARYTVLKKIGVTRKGINKAIFGQVFIYFMMPLALAIVHSIFGIQVVNKAIMVAGSTSVLVPSLITALIIVIVYGGYFFATYTGYKSIVK
ncbi:ABC transporter permease [Peribacillus asahii]|uniref:ABC transporter permease n=1 Tax=Peribacillus asahii TaxID=228899 RepID=A0A398BBZ1_9BACI|nr:ABC transporter permease [Peribacillus asahii]RID86358.1 ABC transporter permease [Peribacillus asahii]